MLTIQSPPYPGFNQVFPAILRAEKALGVRITLVGAGARNVWMEIGGEERQRRFTKDIDLAVMATDRDHYEALRQYFVEQEGYTLSPHFELSLLTPEGTPIDLLPYGPIEEHHEIALGNMTRAAQVQGFQQACDAAVEVQYQEQGSCQVITAGGLMLLKLIALDDRPNQRANDADDLSLFLNKSYDVFLDDIQDQHWDILTAYETDDAYGPQVGSHYLGRMIRQTSAEEPELVARLTRILSGHLQAGPNSLIHKALTRQHGLSPDTATLCLTALQKGFLHPHSQA